MMHQAALDAAARLVAPRLAEDRAEHALTVSDGSTPGTGPPGAGIASRAELARALRLLAVGLPDKAGELRGWAEAVSAGPPPAGVWGFAALDGRFALLAVDHEAPPAPSA